MSNTFEHSVKLTFSTKKMGFYNLTAKTFFPNFVTASNHHEMLIMINILHLKHEKIGIGRRHSFGCCCKIQKVQIFA